MSKATKAAITIGTGSLVIALVLLVQAFRARPSLPPAPLFFLATPVAATGVVTFLISNESQVEVLYAALPPEEKSNGQWFAFQGATVPGGCGLSLASHQATTLLVTAPSNAAVWRLPVLWNYAPTELDVLKQRLQRFVAPQEPTGFKAHTVHSPEVTRE